MKISIYIILFLNLISLSRPLLASENETQTQPKECKVGLYLMSLHDLNPRDNTYSSDFWVWYNYKTFEDFDPLKSRELVNAKTSKRLIEDKVVYEDGTVWATEKMKATFLHSWNTANFPFDRQKLELWIEEGLYETSDIVFVPDKKDSRLSPEIKLLGWELVDFNFDSREKTYESSFGDPEGSSSSSYSRLVMTITLKREALGLFLKMHMGVYIAFAISMLAFLMSAATGDIFAGRISVLVGMLFASVLNLQSVESTLGSSQTLTLVDKIHLTTFLFLFSGIILSLISRKYCALDREATSQKLDRWAMPLFSLSYFAVNIVLISLAKLGG